MQISPITGNTASATPTAATSEAVISSDFETFLKMLTVQMQNQDPLNPTDSAEFAQQLATFSGVEQAVLTNDLLSAMMVQMNTSGMAQMADWVGKEARASVAAQFDGSPITVSPTPVVGAEKVELVVYNSAGNEIQRSAISNTTDTIEWAGVSPNGTPLPAGAYTFMVESSANGNVVKTEMADVYARVQEVRIENGTTVLMLQGGIPVTASAVTALREG